MTNPTITQMLWIDLPGTKGLKIRGILEGDLDKPLAVIVHGKPGSAEGFTPRLTTEELNKAGISCLRLEMYLPVAGTRDFENCTLETYRKDFDTVVEYLRSQGTPKIFAIGHSCGALAVLKSKKHVDGIVLQEPLHGAYWSEHPRKSYKGDSKAKVTAARNSLEELEGLGDTTNWAANKQCPMKIISAGKGLIVEYGARYLAVADKPNEQVIIEGANHLLSNSLNVVHQVVEETVSWLSEVCLDR